MWQCEVKDVLPQQDLNVALEDRYETMSDVKWEKLNRMTCSTIRFCLAKPQKYAVMRETSAKELWQKLEDKYMTKNIENCLYLKKRLYMFQYKEGLKMIQHIDAFNKLIADLLNLDEEIKEEDKALILLNSLHDSYDHLATALIYGKETIKFDEVSNALIYHVVRHQDKESSSFDSLVSRGRSVKRSSSGKNKSFSRSSGKFKSRRSLARDEYAFYHNKGHWKKDCPRLQHRNKYANSNALINHVVRHQDKKVVRLIVLFLEEDQLKEEVLVVKIKVFLVQEENLKVEEVLQGMNVPFVITKDNGRKIVPDYDKEIQEDRYKSPRKPPGHGSRWIGSRSRARRR
ncbi:hypothetical protein ACLB2K_042245 [Fragaria x ananassa]